MTWHKKEGRGGESRVKGGRQEAGKEAGQAGAALSKRWAEVAGRC